MKTWCILRPDARNLHVVSSATLMSQNPGLYGNAIAKVLISVTAHMAICGRMITNLLVKQ
jgi:hypothetical protein